jgi:predicted transcriptional regulator of viral defense system
VRFLDFKSQFSDRVIINSQEIYKQGNIYSIRNQLHNWLKKGLLVKLKRGQYIFSKVERKIIFPDYFWANLLYVPSYISLEYALAFYGLIPEAVPIITSVTANKTKMIKNPEGVFVYQHIKPRAYRGFQQIKVSAGFSCFMAEPEKALVDFVYLNLVRFTRGDKDIFESSYRLQNLESLSARKIKNYAGLFASPKLTDIMTGLVGLIRSKKC